MSRMRSLRAAALGIAVFALVAGMAAAPAAAAQAAPPALAGLWAPLDRCPVDDSAMLAADGRTVTAACLASRSATGSMTIGGTTLSTGAANLQLGVLNQGGAYSLVSPAGGAIIADPVAIPGGLLGLMCPSDIPVISQICDGLVGSPLNTVTAVIEPAGAPSEFDLGAGLSVGQPILTLPVKIRLQNPFLDPNCYIGSNANPILLKPANLAMPTAQFVRFDADGTANPTGEMGYVSLSGAAQGDSTFAVPEADGCGIGGLLDFAVNLKQGLPSPAGENSLVLDNASTQVGGFFTPSRFTPNQGQQLADRWHAAVVG